MTDEETVRQVVDRMRAAGWRGGDEDRLLRTACKRIASAARHEEQAKQLVARSAYLQWHPGPGEARDPRPRATVRLATQTSEQVLVHRVRAAARLLLVSRPERDAALRLAPTWTQSADELLAAARDVLR